jgi:hypothetical protein
MLRARSGWIVAYPDRTHFGVISGLAVIPPQLAKTSRMTCEGVSVRGLVILRQLNMKPANRRDERFSLLGSLASAV